MFRFFLTLGISLFLGSPSHGQNTYRKQPPHATPKIGNAPMPFKAESDFQYCSRDAWKAEKLVLGGSSHYIPSDLIFNNKRVLFDNGGGCHFQVAKIRILNLRTNKESFDDAYVFSGGCLDIYRHFDLISIASDGSYALFHFNNEWESAILKMKNIGITPRTPVDLDKTNVLAAIPYPIISISNCQNISSLSEHNQILCQTEFIKKEGAEYYHWLGLLRLRDGLPDLSYGTNYGILEIERLYPRAWKSQPPLWWKETSFRSVHRFSNIQRLKMGLHQFNSGIHDVQRGISYFGHPKLYVVQGNTLKYSIKKEEHWKGEFLLSNNLNQFIQDTSDGTFDSNPELKAVTIYKPWYQRFLLFDPFYFPEDLPKSNAPPELFQSLWTLKTRDLLNHYKGQALPSPYAKIYHYNKNLQLDHRFANKGILRIGNFQLDSFLFDKATATLTLFDDLETLQLQLYKCLDNNLVQN
jgi:hypothetical protein